MELAYQPDMLEEGVFPRGEFQLFEDSARRSGVPRSQLPDWGFPIVPDGRERANQEWTGLEHSDQRPRRFSVHGKLAIEGVRYPMQSFQFTRTATELMAQNEPDGHWPQIHLRLTLRPGTEVFDLTSFRAVPVGDTVEAQLLVTRVLLGLAGPRRFRFVFQDFAEEFGYELDISAESVQELRGRAALYRKAAYIESVFHTRFSLPEHITGDMVRYVDDLFRGLTEGEYQQRVEEVQLAVDPDTADLARPPFSDIGEVSESQTNNVTLFLRQLDVGPIDFLAKHALVSTPSELSRLKRSRENGIRVRFRLLDWTLRVRFARYFALAAKERSRRLQAFVRTLCREEPEEVASTIFLPLIQPLAREGALRIAFGWLQINRLPDAICADSPELGVDGLGWVVPLSLRFVRGGSAGLSELVIDIYSGAVTAKESPDIILARARSLAPDILHAG